MEVDGAPAPTPSSGSDAGAAAPSQRPRPFSSVAVGREVFVIDIRYSNLKPIGDGSYGFVCSADDAVTGREVAIKKVTDIFRDLGDAKRILRELKLLRHFNLHENVVAILDIMLHPTDTLDFRDIYIVTNLMESDLDRIIASSQPLTDQHFQYFLYQLLRGLKFIHSANVLHRDLKPSNLLVNANCDLAICDFGLARGVALEFEDSLTEYVVTRWYRAPELLCDSPHYGKTVDVWSVGCIFGEMMTRQPIFQGKNPMHQLRTIISALGPPSEEDISFVDNQAAREVVMAAAASVAAEVPEGGPPPRRLQDMLPQGSNPQAVDLLERMLVINPAKRITVEQALEHPYLQDLHSQMIAAEPTCDSLFDFEFEKRFAGPKRRNIPLRELQQLMFREMLHYRPSPRGEEIIARGSSSEAPSHVAGSGSDGHAAILGVPRGPAAAAAAAGSGSESTGDATMLMGAAMPPPAPLHDAMEMSPMAR